MSKVIVGHYTSCPEIEGKMLVDMHSHSTISDGRDDIRVVVEQAKKLGIGISVTDHNAIEGSLYACKETHAIPGIEITSNEALDMLVYFEKEMELVKFYENVIQGKSVKQHGLHMKWYRLQWSMAELLEQAKAANGFTVLPHPDTLPPKNSVDFFYNNKNLLKLLDGVEGLNSVMKRESNANAVMVAAKWKKPVVGGSDAHLAKFLGSAVTACDAHDRASFFEEIRKGRNIVVGDNLRFTHKVHAGFTTIRRNLRWNF